MIKIYEEIINIQRSGGKGVLAIIISTRGSTPRNVGAKMLIKSSGETIGSIGGGEAEKKICEEARKIMESGTPKIVHFDLRDKKDYEIGMICGGVMDIFLEPIISVPHLYIFGAGHIVVPLVKLAKMIGFRVTVVDEREDYASAEKFPEADNVICEEFDRVFLSTNMDKDSYVVIATASHLSDEKVLEKALNTSAKYIGMMGSPNKRDVIFKHLLSRGIKKELLDRVRSPIGLKINSETPEEIAISIVAEIIREFRL